MGRKKVDPAIREAYEQILTIFNPSTSPDFLYVTQVLDPLEDLFRSWENKGFPNIMEDRTVIFDEENGSSMYTGLYYDLQGVCDIYSLRWPQGGQLLIRALNHKVEGGKYTDLELPPGNPPELHWRWFRMARSGLGAPRQNELIGLRQVSSKGRKIKVEIGLIYELIGDIHRRESDESISTSMIAHAIKGCWDYLDSGVNINKVVKHAKYSEMDYWLLIIAHALHLKEKQENRSKNRPKNGSQNGSQNRSQTRSHSNAMLDWEQKLQTLALGINVMDES